MIDLEGIDPVRFDHHRCQAKAEMVEAGTYKDTLEVQRALNAEARKRCLDERKQPE